MAQITKTRRRKVQPKLLVRKMADVVVDDVKRRMKCELRKLR